MHRPPTSVQAGDDGCGTILAIDGGAPSARYGARLQPFSRCALTLLLLFAAGVGCGAWVITGHLTALSAVRSYVAGEAAWSKAQKDAAQLLLAYADSGDVTLFRRFTRAIAVPLGDRAARLELSKAHPDFARAAAGFRRGRNHPDDVQAMVFFFHRFRDSPLFADAVDAWARADRDVLKLVAVGRRLRALHTGMTAPRASAIVAARRKIQTLNARLTPLEEDFARTLNAGARRLTGELVTTTWIVGLLLAVLGACGAAFVVRTRRGWVDRFQSLLASSHDAILVTETDTGTIVDANTSAVALFGLPRRALVGARCTGLTDRLAWPTAPAPRAGDELQIRDRQGRLVPVELTTSPGLWEGRALTYLVMRDVSERRRAHETLRRSEERWRAIGALTSDWAYSQQLAPDGTAILDWTTDAFTRMTGYTLAEARAKGGLTGLIHPDDAAEYAARRRSSRCSWTSAFRLITKSGEVRWVLDHGTRFSLDPATGIVRVYGAIQDVTERKRAEDALRTSQAALERRAHDLTVARNEALEAARTKAAFLANMSHEIRTPMTAILGYVNLIATEQSLPDHERFVAVVKRNGQHLLRILDDILDLSKIEAGALVLDRVPVSLLELLNEVATVMGSRAHEKGLEFVLDVAEGLPDRVETDPTRLRQILLNLIGNAIKFTAEGTVSVRASLLGRALKGRRGMLRLEVVDTGIGIPSAAIERLCTPFSQADPSMTRRFGGTGLGLAISQRLASLLGGGITIQSTPGVGSTFTCTTEVVTLAADEPEIGERRRGSSAKPQVAAPPRRYVNVRVLLADDVPDNRDLFALYLRRAGARVELVPNGSIACEAALAAADAGMPFDVVLMDMQMPDLDGYAATRRLRAAGYRGPIIALTAHALGQERAAALAAGCNAFLSKPIDPETLVAAVGEGAGWTTEPDDTPPEESAPVAEDDPELDQLRSKFLCSLPQRLTRMEQSLAQHDLTTLGRLAHQLKGTAGGYGFSAMSHACALLEHSLAANDPAARKRRLRNVRQLIRQAIRSRTVATTTHPALFGRAS